MKPLAIDLFCGLGGWTEGLLAEGFRVVGFDIERHQYGHASYPAQLVLQDVLTIHGSQFKDAALIVASPPCQAYSYRAMPWKRAKALPPPDNSLFEACFRIQREAEDAAGVPIPMVVENVCGAQKWVGRARWHYGSFYLWGDVPALMPNTLRAAKPKLPPAWILCPCCEDFLCTFHQMHAFECECPPIEEWDSDPYSQPHPLAKPKRDDSKQPGIGGLRRNGKGDGWFQDGAAAFGSRSSARKAASAHIAKIPLPLAVWIARCYYPSHTVGYSVRTAEK